MPEMDRRNFLRLGITVVAGLAMGGASLPVKIVISEKIEELTGRPTGNAAMSESTEIACEKAPDKEKCVQDYWSSDKEKFETVIVAPVIEEALFRTLPSLALSGIVEETEHPFIEAVQGTGGFSMTRKELIVGVVDSLIFGAMHNLTSKGFDTNTIPVSQTMGGFSYWYLQRKLGMFANMSAHALNNFNFLALVLKG